MHPHTYVHVQVRGLLEDVRDDAATSFKALLWLALGTAGLVMTLVLVGQGGDGHSFFAYKADLQAMQKFNQDGLLAPVATVCPMPLTCPPWCDGRRNVTCRCTPGEKIDWSFLSSVGMEGAKCEYVTGKGDGDRHGFSEGDIRQPPLVPVEYHDGRVIQHDHCLQLNWPMQWKEKGWESYITCGLYTNLKISDWDTQGAQGLLDEYPGAVYDAVAAIQFHANPNVHSPDPWEDKDTGVKKYSNAWFYSTGFRFREYQLQPVILRTDSDKFWNTKVTLHNDIQFFVPGDKHNNKANSLIPFLSFEMYYLRAEWGIEWLTEIDGTGGARHSLGLAGGIAFLLCLLNLTIFCVVATAFGWNTELVRRRMMSVGGAPEAVPYDQVPRSGGTAANAPFFQFNDGAGAAGVSADSRGAAAGTSSAAKAGGGYGSIGDA